MAEATSESRAAALVQELRSMIAASYIAGDKAMTAETRHAGAAFRALAHETLEKAAEFVEKSPAPLDAAVLAAAIRALKESGSAPPG